MRNYTPHIRTRPDYNECRGPADEQPDFCAAVPRGDEDSTKEALVKLGYAHPELRPHLRPILDVLD